MLGATFYSPYRRYPFYRNSFAPVQFGYAVGLGYQLPASLSLTLRYTSDLTDIYSHEVLDGNTHRHQGITWGGDRNSVFQAQLGYLLPGRK